MVHVRAAAGTKTKDSPLVVSMVDGRLLMWKDLIWKLDLLIYRLFYWRWSPRLKNDPDLAYLFSKIGASWTNGNPPRNPEKVDRFIVEEFTRLGKPPTTI